jgi:glycosyltransferase involved in cell wall biosynthesis
MNMHLPLIGNENSTIMSQAPDFSPMRIVEIEIGDPLPTVSAFDEKTGQHYQRAICLVRLHTQPLGLVELQLGESGMNADESAQQIWRTFSAKINEHLRQDGLLPVTELDAAGLPSSSIPRCIEERDALFANAPFVSVIVSTRDRPEAIQRCLRSLVSLYYPHYEVIVIDNAPSTNETADFIRQAYHDVQQVRCMREERPGASWARNCGILAAKGEILAFTDDDVVVDPYWLVEMVRAFSIAEDVACVTGLVLPLELESPAQFWFEEHEGVSERFTRRIFDMLENHPKKPLYPYIVGQFGTGSSMAFTAAFLRSIGGFDPALGPGSQAPAGEELALFFRVVTRGNKLVYTPTALLYHLHRRGYPGLRQQIYNYGVGLTAYLMKILFDNPRLLFDLVTKLPYGLYFSLSSRSSLNKKKSIYYPKDLTRVELKAMLYGPFAYLRSRWAVRDVYKTFRAKLSFVTLPRSKEI